MVEDFGETAALNGGDARQFCLTLMAEPLELSWHHCGLTSDFIGEYFSRACGTGIDPVDARHSISYMINEILENAIKFRHGGDIAIHSSLEEQTFEIRIVNRIDQETAVKFQGHLKALLDREPGELLLERIEENALNPDSSGSGLGLLTLMSDYEAKLGWSFASERVSEGVELTTYASLRLS
ncbi:slr1658 superfamily regulator [Roseibium aggregatum]|uniref:slr1658 superfamily regulator n=1 Tax=Roseibium aggregatum TaxID=187304 RepID=UPI001E365D36|nr:ATP-binding protein [Roseibium aggregatum]UES46850.1 ATP-binding protein [Roseibium aggregatum]